MIRVAIVEDQESDIIILKKYYIILKQQRGKCFKSRCTIVL